VKKIIGDNPGPCSVIPSGFEGPRLFCTALRVSFRAYQRHGALPDRDDAW